MSNTSPFSTPFADIKVSEVELSIRTSNALQAQKFGITLGDVAAMTDDQLLRIPNFGRKSLKEIREVCRAMRFVVTPLETDIKEWVSQHYMLLRALMAGEAVIVPK